jgi:hypothetical protein
MRDEEEWIEEEREVEKGKERREEGHYREGIITLHVSNITSINT